MLVKVNGEKIDLAEGSTIRDAIDAVEAPYLPGCVLGLIKGTKEVEKHVNKYRLKTNKGSIIIEILDDAPDNLVQTWKAQYKEFSHMGVRWITSQEVAVGPIKTQLTPTREEYHYHRWDVLFSLSGFTADATHIILSKVDHKATYGAPEENRGVFARVVGGKRTIMKLTDDDEILEIKPVMERENIIKSAAITNLETLLEEGNQIFTYVKVKPNPKSPQSVEQFYALQESGKIRVDYDSNSFAGFYALQGLEKKTEQIDQRKRGTITLRNSGKGMGRVYIYREDRVSTPSHNVLGTVERGMELLDMARYGDEVTFRTSPSRIMTLAMTQKEAEEFLRKNGVKQIRAGLADDNAVVVQQEPPYTMDIIAQGDVKTFGIPEEDLVHVELDQQAPRSNWYFQKITGLLDSPIGSLSVHFAFPGMKLLMFKAVSKESKGLIPENTPQDMVKAGELGVTNMSRRHIGMVGVRFEDNQEFGPTGEPFQGTNIIGKVVKGMEHLEKYKEGDKVYVTRK
ncbi:methyl-coenzyme M reductase-associated protein Mmp3 [Methanobacterium ferruginis]|uniref:methyl-coenzyme M reductase-associated protein Mmp3 n=1 Tax=Methanobacterium ferruginis TaxID=710191 RepID=UPI00257251FE|nr:methanogenesis marker 3 protein [Methanobacterium ferruginis]BDZ69192.1 methanogenesis marker 3 protein [Methanobacterium ferruginis]